MKKWTLICLNWAFVGDTKLSKRAVYFSQLMDNQSHKINEFELPTINEKYTLIDYTVDAKTGEW